jgi:hypothetical protein
MRIAGRRDDRPLTGPVTLPLALQDAVQLVLLTTDLALPIVNLGTSEINTDWLLPSLPTTYRLYPGGPQYTVPALPANLQNTTLQPDPATNPLGMFRVADDVTIGNNVTLRGTLIVADDLTVQGTNSQLSAPDLPALYGSTTPIQLPVLQCEDFTVSGGCNATIRGFAGVYDKFEVLSGTETTRFNLTGRLVAEEIRFGGRTQWSTFDWKVSHIAFLLQFALGDKFFPEYAARSGRNHQPLLTVRPDPSPVTYHWKRSDATETVYVAHPDDPGLRWDLLEWVDAPS